MAALSTTPVCSPPQPDLALDVFDNLFTTADFTNPASELVIASELVVQQSAVTWPVSPISPEAHNIPFGYSSDDVTDLDALRFSEHPYPTDVELEQALSEVNGPTRSQ